MWIEINNKNSINEFGNSLVIKNVTITPPQVKKYKIEIPYSSNIVDLSLNKAFYGPLYIEVSINITSSETESLYEVYSRFLDFISVSRSKIKLSGYDDFYYLGSCAEISSFEDLKVCGNLTLKLECDSWKYKDFKLSLTGLKTNNEFILKGSKMGSFPLIECNTNCTIQGNGKSYALKSGINYLYDIELNKDSHKFKLTTGTNINLKISYRRGFL